MGGNESWASLVLKGESFWNMWPKLVDVMNCIRKMNSYRFHLFFGDGTFFERRLKRPKFVNKR